MATYTIDESQRKAARLAGFAFLFAMAIVVLANYGINFQSSQRPSPCMECQPFSVIDIVTDAGGIGH